jgi:hypothetical protein
MVASRGHRRATAGSDTACTTLPKVRAGVKQKKHICARTWQPSAPSTPLRLIAAPTPLSSTSTMVGVAEVASRSRAEMPPAEAAGESESMAPASGEGGSTPRGYALLARLLL